MTVQYAHDLWKRAKNALRSAEALLEISGDDAVSRAYYAAFDAVSAAFALQGKTFTRHTAVRTAIHRDWVKSGIWTQEMGQTFDMLWELRDIGDYGGGVHAETHDAANAVKAASQILEAVRRMCPSLAHPPS